MIGLMYVSFDAHAQVYSTQTGKVEFFSESTLGNFSGVSTNVVGQVNLADSTLDFYVDTNTLSTGIKLRDKHMRENHLNSDEFPLIKFFGKMHGFDATRTGEQSVKAKGMLTIRGKTREIEVDGFAMFKQQKLIIKARWTVKLTDYEIPRPEFLFLKVSDEQKISLNVSLDSKNEE